MNLRKYIVMLTVVLLALSAVSCKEDKMVNNPGTEQLDFTSKKITLLMPQTLSGYEETLLSELKKITPDITTAAWGEDVLDTEKADLVIIAGADKAPAGTAAKAEAFLKDGGRLLTLGGPPFNEQMHLKDGTWFSFEELTEQFAQVKEGKTLLIDASAKNEVKKISHNTDNPKGGFEVTFGDSSPNGDTAIKIYIENMQGWDSAKKIVSIPAGDNAVAFWAKGDEKTGSLCMELGEKDGSRWIATLTISTEWKYYILTAEDYKFWSDSSSGGRGGDGDTVNMSNATYMTIGLAQSHTPVELGEHEFYLAGFCSSSFEAVSEGTTVMEGLSPEYKFYPITNGEEIKSFDNQILVRSGEYKLTEGMFSLSPRPQGTGFMMGRDFRFIPLLEVYDQKGLRSGFAAWMYSFTPSTATKGTYDGARLAGFGATSPDFYDEAGLAAVCDTVRAMLLDALLLEGGASEYIYLDDVDKISAGVHSTAKYPTDAAVELTLSEGKKVLQTQSYTLDDEQSTIIKSAKGINIYKSIMSYEIEGSKPDKAVSVLKIGGVEVDKIEQSISYWSAKPASERKYIYEENNEFMLDGKPIRFYGVNYMPTSGIATEDGKYFEQYVSREAYDPDVFYKDLLRVKEVGFNAVSLFVYYDTVMESANILHLIDMCEGLGLYVDLSLRPYANPLEYNESQVQTLIEKLHFADNSNISAYDIAWERAFGTYEGDYGNYAGRKANDNDWRTWIDAQYGSVENAEAIWGETAPKGSDGQVIGVPDSMLTADAGHEKLVAAYRRFADDLISRKHAYATDHIKSIDPNHLVSARTGGAGSIPLADPAQYGYDFGALASSLDFMSPESYALSASEYSMRQGVFTNMYARFANYSPVVWKEYGRHIWTGSNFGDNSRFEKLEAEYYTFINDMMLTGHTGGAYCWWWAGGYRVGENSDYGVVNPDGSDRQVTGVLRKYAPLFLDHPILPQADYFILINRDAFSTGIKGVYESIQDELFAAVKSGKTVAFTSGAEDCDTSNVPAIGVGDVDYSTQMPLKYVNGQIRKVEIVRADGSCETVKRGSTFKAGDGEFTIRVSVCNTGRSTWADSDTGAVHVVSTADSGLAIKLDVDGAVPYLGIMQAEGTYTAHDGSVRIALRFEAQDRFIFGDEFVFTLTK